MSPFLRTVCLAVVLCLCGLTRASAQGMMFAPPPPLPAGCHAPDFQFTSINGKKPLSLKSLRGKVILIDYWATWCGPCRMATPLLQRLHRQYAKRGLIVLGISVDDPQTQPQIKPFLRQFGVTYPIAILTQATMQTAMNYHADSLPSQYLIDKHGIVRWSQAGYSPSEGPEITARIQHLLAEKG